jgi:hypothetical protein
MARTHATPAAPSAAPAYLFILLALSGLRDPTFYQLFPFWPPLTLAMICVHLTYRNILADASAAFCFHHFAVGSVPVMRVLCTFIYFTTFSVDLDRV